MPAEAHEGPDGRHANRRLGKYELIRRLAVGGMAEIFLARVKAAHGFEKLVVVKRILPQYAEDEEFVRMLLDEARLAATLHHPNIVQVYDMGVDDDTGQSFFSMEYVRGQDLRKIIRACHERERALPLEHVLDIVIGTAAGLHHAHDQPGHDGRPLAIVHRDVSPSNILVTYAGAVKLVDFGIAKATVAQSTTRHGTLKGKIPYMSPEQCRGERLDRRSDIFSLGTVLWELSTGARLWKGANELATLSRIANEDAPPPSWKRPEYPPELERIVMRALARDRDVRYQSAQELQLELEGFAREQKLPVSSAYLARFMQELFADQIVREVAEARAEPDGDIQTLLTADLEFLAPQLLEGEGKATAKFSPGELRPHHDDEAPDTGRTPSRQTHSQSVVLDVGGRLRHRKWITIGATAGAVIGGIGLLGWVALGRGPEPVRPASPAPTQAAAQVEPSVSELAPAVAPPAPSPSGAAVDAAPAPDPAPVEKKGHTRGTKTKKKKKKDWNPDSFLPP